MHPCNHCKRQFDEVPFAEIYIPGEGRIRMAGTCDDCAEVMKVEMLRRNNLVD